MNNYNYSTTHRCIELLSVFIFVLTFLSIVIKIMFVMSGNIDTGGIIAILISIMIAYLCSDFLTGLLHFLLDNFGSTTAFWIGPNLIKPFREHHNDPKSILEHDFLEVNGNSCLMGLVVLTLFITFTEISASNLYVLSFTLSLILFMVLTNQIHKWSHLNYPPYLIDRLQKYNLILNPNHHNIHHSYPFNKYYCITNGWLNPLLTQLNFFEKFKQLIITIQRQCYEK